MTRYSREDVLTEREFELLLRGARELEPPADFEATLTLFATGALGMRGGEVAHLDTDWIHWPNRTIRIPEFDPCDRGKDGGVCGYCRNRARDYAETNDVAFEDALETRWSPKTQNSERAIPFDFDVRIELTIEDFDERYDRFPKSRSTLNRRVKQAADKADLERRIYPHSLRATAASRMASRGVTPYALMSVLGWVDLETARTYIRASDESAARELRSKHR